MIFLIPRSQPDLLRGRGKLPPGPRLRAAGVPVGFLGHRWQAGKSPEMMGKTWGNRKNDAKILGKLDDGSPGKMKVVASKKAMFTS